MDTRDVKKWHVGSVEIARIIELQAWEIDPTRLLPGVTPTDVLAVPWLVPDFASPAGVLLLSFQAFAIRAGDRRIVVDTCLGADRWQHRPEFSYLESGFIEDLTNAGFPPESIDTVLCTHLHYDHVGWNVRLVDNEWEPTFRNARYLISGREWAHTQEARVDREEDFRHLATAVDPIVEAGLVDLVSMSHRITDEVWLEPTPGHSPGHVSVHIASEGEEAVITGDMIHHPIQLLMLDQYDTFDEDHELAAQTRAKFAERYADTSVRVFGSHFSGPTVGWIRREGSQYKLVPDGSTPT